MRIWSVVQLRGSLWNLPSYDHPLPAAAPTEGADGCTTFSAHQLSKALANDRCLVGLPRRSMKLGVEERTTPLHSAGPGCQGRQGRPQSRQPVPVRAESQTIAMVSVRLCVAWKAADLKSGGEANDDSRTRVSDCRVEAIVGCIPAKGDSFKAGRPSTCCHSCSRLKSACSRGAPSGELIKSDSGVSRVIKGLDRKERTEGEEEGEMVVDVDEDGPDVIDTEPCTASEVTVWCYSSGPVAPRFGSRVHVPPSAPYLRWSALDITEPPWLVEPFISHSLDATRPHPADHWDAGVNPAASTAPPGPAPTTSPGLIPAGEASTGLPTPPVSYLQAQY
ncbi:hypothetical protein CCMA1212_006824 [Trichoderma ghanense]|uniref:Uncharacterized protein n=1 Tax=Trichoderma ghanense TaxID=65468 RepID=A0ABY2H1J5_9HYPO